MRLQRVPLDPVPPVIFQWKGKLRLRSMPGWLLPLGVPLQAPLTVSVFLRQEMPLSAFLRPSGLACSTKRKST